MGVEYAYGCVGMAGLPKGLSYVLVTAVLIYGLCICIGPIDRNRA